MKDFKFTVLNLHIFSFKGYIHLNKGMLILKVFLYLNITISILWVCDIMSRKKKLSKTAKKTYKTGVQTPLKRKKK